MILHPITRRPSGVPVNPVTQRILDLHAEGLCVRETAAAVGCTRQTVYSAYTTRGLRSNFDPRRVRRHDLIAEQEERSHEAGIRADELVESGEPDRRACCYFVFGLGGTDAAAADRSGATLAEVEKFRREMPDNWNGMGVGGDMV